MNSSDDESTDAAATGLRLARVVCTPTQVKDILHDSVACLRRAILSIDDLRRGCDIVALRQVVHEAENVFLNCSLGDGIETCRRVSSELRAGRIPRKDLSQLRKIAGQAIRQLMSEPEYQAQGYAHYVRDFFESLRDVARRFGRR